MSLSSSDGVLSGRHSLIFAVVAVIGAFLVVYGWSSGPAITDSYYHFNAATQLASGHGLTDAYLWHYIGAPDALPAPSHLYWMPFTSFIAALGMWLAGAPGSYVAAQWPFALLLAGVVWLAFWLGARLGGQVRYAWLAGILALMGGYFARFWGQTDTFAPYALVGALALVCIGQGITRWQDRYWAAAGALAALGHLTRADGLLLLLVAWACIVWPFYRDATLRPTWRQQVRALLVVTLAYLLLMAPWMIRNYTLTGSVLVTGGTQSIWFTEYDDLFSYPPDAGLATFFADGVGLLLSTRWQTLLAGLGTLIAVEGVIVLTPLMLIALWWRRADPFLRGLWVYALGVHLAMIFMFAFPGLRGGLFHSVAALWPWWMALGIIGLDDVILWIAQRRRNWRADSARWVFVPAVLFLVGALTVMLAAPNRGGDTVPAFYAELAVQLPEDARVMINDPARLFYYTGLGGVVLPHEAPPVIEEIARVYGVDYVLIERDSTTGNWVLSHKLRGLPEDPPDFLTEIDIQADGVKLYAVTIDSPS